MYSFLSYFAERPFLARIITVMVLIFGAASLTTLKFQEYPNVVQDAAEIETFYPGATAQDVEFNITNPIEKELLSVEGVKFFFSESSAGYSYIELEFESGSNSSEVLRDIQQAVDRVQGLPKDITNPPVVIQPKTTTLDILSFGLSIKDGNTNQESTTSHADLQHYARILEKKLKTIPGVGNIILNGYNEREFWVEINPDKASRFNVTFDEINDAVVQHNLSQSGGIVESNISEKKIVTMTQVESIDDLKTIVVKVLPNGTLVRVSDVANVHDTFMRATQTGMLNGKDAIIFSVASSENSDVVSTVANINQLFEREQARLDNKFEYDINMNLADDMSDKFTVVSTNGGIGLVLVLLVLSFILKRQLAFWVSISIPFCLFGVMFILPFAGLNLDSITLSALLLVTGIIVDDSVIIAESIYQEKERGKTGIKAAVAGTQKVIKPIIASLTTTALVFIPMTLIPGTMGKAIGVIPIAVIAALIFSFAECTLTLPAHLAESLKTEKKDKTDKFAKIAKSYRGLLLRCLRFKKTVVLASVLISAFCLSLISTLSIDIFPTEAAKYVRISTEVKPGTPLEQVRAAHQVMEQAIQALPDTELAGYEMAYQSPVSEGRLTLTNYEDRDRTAAEILRELNAKVATIEDSVFIKFTIDAGGPPPGDPVEIRVLGGTTAEREHAVKIVSNWMIEHPGLTKVSNSEALREPQLNIVPQYQWLAKYNLSVTDLSNTLHLAFEGNTDTSTWVADEEVDIRVILDEPYRDIHKLNTTKVYTPDGQNVPLSRLARIEPFESPQMIKHYNGEREITVSAEISDDSVSPVALSDELVTALKGKYASNVTIDVGGEAESTNETMSGFVIAFPTAIIAIYFVLALMFNSLLQPLLVMAVIPFAAIASLMALVVHLQDLSMFALIGVLGMTGVVVNNSLVLINRINEFRAQGLELLDAVVEASVNRLRPILLTSFTTVAGLLPLAYGLGGTDVYMGPMSLTLGYGLLFSLPVVLLVVPALYAIGGQISRHR